ncbi:MAG: hypothetical protein JWP01_2919 [Myxococcales bacterium]|nr:hypothetical protein [Myxococcales bacterium]
MTRRDVKEIGRAAGGLVAQTLVTLADGDHTPSYIGIGRMAAGDKLKLTVFDGGLDDAKAWITLKDKHDAVVVGLDEAEREVRLLLGSSDATRKYDMICSVRYQVQGMAAPQPAQRGKKGKPADPAIKTSTIGFLNETTDDKIVDDFLDSVLAGIYGHARAKELDVGKLGDYDDLE